jgi:polysaccharide biosynthesis protein PslH
MSARPHILFLSQCLPYPPDTGVTARTFNILRQLSKEFDLSLVAFSRSNHQADCEARTAARRALEELAEVYKPVPMAAEHSCFQQSWNHLRSLVTNRPYTFYEYGSKDYERELRHALSRRPPDLIHLDSLDLHRWTSGLPAVPKMCTHHDVESELLRRRADITKSSLLRAYIYHQASLVERTQRKYCPQFSANIMMSPLDAQRLKQLAPGARTVVVPNGVDTDYFLPASSSPQPGRVVFIGSPASFPNRDAVEFLLSDIWPRVRSAHSSASLQLIGRCSESDRRRYAKHPGVTVLGLLPDIRPSVAQACCCVVPIRVGGGTRVKILDSWAMGKAVISTTIGCEGLDAIDGDNILIRDAPESFADGISEVLSSPELNSGLGLSARRTAETKYSWDVIGSRIRAFYREQLHVSAAVSV